MVHAVVLLIIVLVAAPLAQNIPLATLSAILMFVAWNMGEWHEFARLKQFSNNYRIILLATFLLTVIMDLTVAVEVGLVLACLFFIARVSSLTRIEPISPEELHRGGADPTQVQAYRVTGSLFFGAVDKIDPLLDPTRSQPKVMVLEMSQVLNLDTTGLEALQNLHGMLHKRGGRLILCALATQPRSLFDRAGFTATLGQENLVDTLAQGLQRSAETANGTPHPAS